MRQKLLKLIRYGISGSLGAITHIGVLSLLTDFFKIHYLISTTVGFIASYFVSFFMQKHWTFKNSNNEKLRSQMIIYFIIGSINLGLNAVGMRVMVGSVGLHHILSQIVVSGSIAIYTFFIYRLIFKENNENINPGA